MSEMTDKELLGYAEIHCRTEVAAFHVDHLNRILDLAGKKWCDMNNYIPKLDTRKQWYNVGDDLLQPVIDAARAKMSTSTLAQQVANAQAETDAWPDGKLERVKLAGGDQP